MVITINVTVISFPIRSMLKQNRLNVAYRQKYIK